MGVSRLTGKCNNFGCEQYLIIYFYFFNTPVGLQYLFNTYIYFYFQLNENKVVSYNNNLKNSNLFHK